jgi:hypothetical protein
VHVTLFLDIERVMLCLCSQAALERKSLAGMTQCWSSGSSYDNFPKSADLACEHYCQSCCCSVAQACALVLSRSSELHARVCKSVHLLPQWC